MNFILIAEAASSTLGGGGSTPPSGDLQSLVLNIYNLALLFGGLLAFLMILLAAVKYALQPDNSGAQSDARDQILQAFFGLLLLLGAYIVLNTINPEIVNIRLPQLAPIKEPQVTSFKCDPSKSFFPSVECGSKAASPCPSSKPVCLSDCRGGFKCVAQ